VRTTIFYRHPDETNEALITWEMPQIPRVGEQMSIHIPGLGQFDGTVIMVRYYVSDGMYVCYVTFAA
jgi:hypothetical protein